MWLCCCCIYLLNYGNVVKIWSKQIFRTKFCLVLFFLSSCEFFCFVLLWCFFYISLLMWFYWSVWSKNIINHYNNQILLIRKLLLMEFCSTCLYQSFQLNLFFVLISWMNFVEGYYNMCALLFFITVNFFFLKGLIIFFPI